MKNRRFHHKNENRPNGWNILVLIGICINVYLLLSFFFGEMGHFNATKIRAMHQKIQTEVASLQAENRQLAHRVEALRHDEAAIERLARERLGLVKSGELVYEFFEMEGP